MRLVPQSKHLPRAADGAADPPQRRAVAGPAAGQKVADWAAAAPEKAGWAVALPLVPAAAQEVAEWAAAAPEAAELAVALPLVPAAPPEAAGWAVVPWVVLAVEKCSAAAAQSQK